MIKILFTLGLCCLMLITFSQQFTPISLTGFNEDVIADGNLTANASTTTSFDGTGDAQNFVFFANDYPHNQCNGLPEDGEIQSETEFIKYQLEDYSGNNVLLLTDTTEKILTLKNPKNYSQLSFCVSSADGSSDLEIRIYYADGSISDSTITVKDWYYRSYEYGRVAICTGRVKRSNEEIGCPFCLRESFFATDSLNVIKEIGFRKSTTGTRAGVFAISGKESSIPLIYYFPQNEPDLGREAVHDTSGRYESVSAGEGITSEIGGSCAVFQENSSMIELAGINNQYLNSLTNANDSLAKEKGYSISFWIFVPEIDTSTSSLQGLPYTLSDDVFQIFCAKTDTNVQTKFSKNGINIIEKHPEIAFGMQRIKDRLVINRLSKGRSVPWKMWLWDPVAFNLSNSWYHIVVIVKYNKTKVYMLDAEGNIYCRLNYFQAPDLADVIKWNLGTGYASFIKTNMKLDEFKIFAKPLGMEEVKILHNYEKPDTFSDLKSVKVVELVNEDLPELKENVQKYVKVYPNPTEGPVNAEIGLDEDLPVDIVLYDLQGRILYQHRDYLASGIHNFQLQNLNSCNCQDGRQMIIFKVSTKNWEEVHKIILSR